MRTIIPIILLSLLAPVASAGADGDCHDTDAGLVCVGDYAWTEGDDCESDSLHERGTGVWAETAAGHVAASGFWYCNVYGGYDYYEQGVHARADTDVVFLEVSWNKWEFVDHEGPYDDGGCSTWVWYVGPAYGYYQNFGCPAGDPPADPGWGRLLP